MSGRLTVTVKKNGKVSLSVIPFNAVLNRCIKKSVPAADRVYSKTDGWIMSRSHAEAVIDIASGMMIDIETVGERQVESPRKDEEVVW